MTENTAGYIPAWCLMEENADKRGSKEVEYKQSLDLDNTHAKADVHLINKSYRKCAAGSNVSTMWALCLHNSHARPIAG